MTLVSRIERRTPCFAPCADCNCRPDLIDVPFDHAEVIMTPQLRAQIDAPKIAKQQSWDEFFLGMAKYVSTKSKDPSKPVGAVIVRPDSTVASIGFNGFPQAMPDVQAWYDDKEEKNKRIVHAEVNAVIFAREPIKGYTCYTWPLAPCSDGCSQMLIQAGIKRFVAPRVAPTSSWAASIERTRQYCRDCGIELLEVDFE
jgi:dCMP deaminase